MSFYYKGFRVTVFEGYFTVSLKGKVAIEITRRGNKEDAIDLILELKSNEKIFPRSKKDSNKW